MELVVEFAQDIGLFTGLDQNNKASAATVTSTVNGASSNTFLSPQILKHWSHSIGRTFLGYAAERGFARLARVAVQHAGHDFNEMNRQGQTLSALTMLAG